MDPGLVSNNPEDLLHVDIHICIRIRKMVIGFSAGNYQIMDEEPSVGMVIPLGITIVAQGPRIHLRNIFLQGITSSLTRNPPEEWLFHRK
jgi:hypothetical protein